MLPKNQREWEVVRGVLYQKRRYIINIYQTGGRNAALSIAALIPSYSWNDKTTSLVESRGKEPSQTKYWQKVRRVDRGTMLFTSHGD